MIQTSFLLMILFISFCSTSKLNVPRVLLPISPKTPVNFTLEVSDGGCYTWTSSRPEAVKVIPVAGDDRCSRTAVVTSIGTSSHKTSAIVLAQEISTGELLRCDVILNSIHTIQIAMKTRELFIEDAPEEFYARASDEQGNEFSSVDGLIFRWTFEGHSTDPEPSNEPVLRWVQFSDSSYEVKPSIAALETLGYQGHVILIEGLRTGSAKVSVRLEDEFFKNVPTVDVNIVVIANLVLDPPEVYLLPGTVVHLKLSQIRQGKAEVISLPSSQYYLEVDNPAVSAVIENTGSVRALVRGSTNIRLRDRNMKDPNVSHAPYVTVNVVHPHRLSLALLPERSWATVLDKSHAIQVELFDEHGNLIQPNDDLLVQVTIPPAFTVERSTRNGTYHNGKASTLGAHKVRASLRLLRLTDGTELELNPSLKSSADMEIFESISVSPSRQVLAWDPITQPRHEIKYKATGGVSSHHFVSSNTSFAAVSQSGVAKTLGQGWCTISAFVPKYPHVRGDASLYVLPAFNMSILPHAVEVEEGSSLLVPVTMMARLPNGEKVAFNDCVDVSIGIELSDRKHFEVGPLTREVPKLKGCRSIPVVATGISVTKLALTFTDDKTIITDSVVVSSYRKLRHLEPANGETVLALGSSRLIVFEGGPLPWINKPSGHYRQVHIANETVASVGSLTAVSDQVHLHKDVYQVEVFCQQIGETEIIYRVGNTASPSNLHPVQASSQIKVSCAHPAKIHIFPEVRLPENSRVPCSVDSVSQRTAAQSYLDLKLITILRDNRGRQLDSYSSVELDWGLSNSELGKLNREGIVVETKQVDGYPTLGRSYRLLKPAGKTGPLDVSVRIAGYKEDVLKKLKLSEPPSLIPPPIQTDDDDGVTDKLSYSTKLILVDDVRIASKGEALFNHPKNQMVLHLKDGSRNFHLSYQSKDVARVEYNPANGTIQIVPLMNGELRIAVSDQCLWTHQPATATIQVVGISRIELQVSDKIEQGSSVPMGVKLFDTQDQPLSASVLPFVKLKPVLGSSIVRVKSIEGLDHTLEGVALGDTTVSFSAAGVRSSVVNVQVFAPLKLSPRNITLVLGATMQVVSSGGPQPDAIVKFSLENEDLATCSSNGIIDAVRIGRTKLLARAVGIDRLTGKSRVYSQDRIDVHIIRLSGVRISSPLTRLRQNTEMPIHLMGLDDFETPFAFGTCHPPLIVEWQLSDHQSGQVSSAFIYSGLDPWTSGSQFAVRFKALQPGHTTLKVKVTTCQPNTGQLEQAELTDEVSIQVYESLQLISPYSTSGDVIVMMPNTEVNLRTNLDSSSSVDYTVQGLNDVAIVSDGKGNLRSGSSLGHASLITTAVNAYGVGQSLSTLVEVRSVSYVILTASPLLNLATGARLSVIPRGFNLELVLSYRDALGRSFHGVRNQLVFRPNRFDLIRVSFDPDNATLTVHADRVGQTVLSISDELNSGLKDYLRFDVADVIHPQQVNLILGDVVCFTTSVLSLNGNAGKWSADSKMVEIDPQSGVAVVVGVGNSEVAYSISDKQTTTTEVKAGPDFDLRFEEATADQHTITDAKRAGQVFVIGLRSKGEPSLIGNNCSGEAVTRFMRHRIPRLTCSISFTADTDILIEDVLNSKADFDVKTGFYQCVVKAVGNPTAVTSTLDTDVIVTAQFANTTAQLIMPFHPAVFIQTPELHVSDLQPATHLMIIGKSNLLRTLEVSSSDSSALSVYAHQHPSPTSIKIPVRFNRGYLGDNSMSSIFIRVHCPLTGQVVQVPVKLKVFGDHAQCAPDATWVQLVTSVWHFVQDRAVGMLTLLGTCAAVYIGYRAISGVSSNRTTSNNVAFLPPGGISGNSESSSGYASPFIRRGPQLWSVDGDSSLQQQSGLYPRSPNSPPVTSSPLLNRRQSPF